MGQTITRQDTDAKFCPAWIAQAADGRRFKIEAGLRYWSVWQIDQEGYPLPKGHHTSIPFGQLTARLVKKGFTVPVDLDDQDAHHGRV